MASYQLGVMQGRLLPKYEGRYQAHPLGYWQDEFAKAQEFGLDLIEFILDHNDWEQNPLMSEAGIQAIQKISDQTGVGVKTVCADYFMQAPLHSENASTGEQSLKVLNTLLNHGHRLGITDVVIPCVDQSSLADEAQQQRFVKNLTPVLDLAERVNINLSLETDLPPKAFLQLLEQFPSQRVSVNYDTGNSAALGYDPAEELQTYGDRVTDIHIKDRQLNGGPVMLGTGNTDFEKFFTALKTLSYQGPFIMQAFRDDEGVGVFGEQLEWIRQKFNQHYDS